MPLPVTEMGIPDHVSALYDRVARLERRPIASGGFDPNEYHVIIGSLSTGGGGSTPTDLTGALGLVSLGYGCDSGGIGAVAVGSASAPYTGALAAGGGGAAVTGNYGIRVGWAGTAAANAISVGQSAAAYAAYAIAHGDSADVGHTNAVGIGRNAKSGAANVVALGYNSFATIANQVKLGADTTHFTEVCLHDSTYGSILVMKSPNGTRYALQVSNAGAFSVIASPV